MRDDAYEHLVVVDGADDPVLAPPGRPAALEPEPQRLADALRILGERAAEEVDDGSGHHVG